MLRSIGIRERGRYLEGQLLTLSGHSRALPTFGGVRGVQGARIRTEALIKEPSAARLFKALKNLNHTHSVDRYGIAENPSRELAE